MSALDMVLQRQVPARPAARQSDFGAASNGQGETARDPFSEVLSGQQKAEAARSGGARTGSGDTAASVAKQNSAPDEPSGEEAAVADDGSGDVMALLDELMSSAAFARDSDVGAPAGTEGTQADGETDAQAMIAQTGDDLPDGAANRALNETASAPPSRQAILSDSTADPESAPADDAAEGPVDAGVTPGVAAHAARTGNEATTTAPQSGVQHQAAMAAGPGATPVSPRERGRPEAEAREALRTLGVDPRGGQDRYAEAGSRPDPRGDQPLARTAATAARQPDERQETLPRNIEVLESRRFMASQPLGGNAQMLTRALMDAGEAARAGPVQSPATIAAGQPQSPQMLQTLKLQLNPASLGSVTAVLKLSGEELQVNIKVETAEAYRQLSDDNQAILKALRSQGYGVEQITIQHVAGGERGTGQAQQSGFQPGLQGGGSGEPQASGGNEGEGRNGREQATGRDATPGREANVQGNPGGAGRSDGVYL